MNLIPSNRITAEVNFLEFYNTKSKLGAGTYAVTESDGDINYVVLNGFGAEQWFSEREYADAIQGQVGNQSQDDRLDEIMRQDLDEELSDSWDIAMIRQEGNRLADEISVADYNYGDLEVTDTEFDRYANDAYTSNAEASQAFDAAMSEPVKTLGEMIHEYNKVN